MEKTKIYMIVVYYQTFIKPENNNNYCEIMNDARFRSKTVEDFLSNFTSSSTIRGYRCHLKNFFEVIEKDPETYIVDVRRLENSDKLDVLEEYERDINKFWKWLIDHDLSPKTVSNSVNCVRVFLKQYRIRLDDVVWENIRRRGTGNKPVTKELPVTKEMLKQILIHGDAKAKALFLVAASSGLRVGELVQLKLTDIESESSPTKIIVRYTGPNSVKTKTSRITFITDEATIALREWLKQRDGSIALAVKRTNFPNAKKNPDDDRVFPFQTNNVRNIWNGLLEKTGLDQKDERTGRYLIHIHSLRKYFRTRFSRHNRDIAEILMGHEGYLGTYRQFTEDELIEEFKKGAKHLLVFETSVDSEELIEMQKSLEETKKKLTESDEKIDAIQKGLLDDPEFKMNLLNLLSKEWNKLQREKKKE